MPDKSEDEADQLKHSHLDAAHRRLGARMVPFGGWEMPLSYPEGTVAEHMACRKEAVAFDVSHLGSVRVEGPDALERLQKTLTNDLNKVGPGRAQYTHMLNPTDASVTDDIIVWWLRGGRAGDSSTDNKFDVMPNASNTANVLERIGGTEITRTRALIAVQGPHARERLKRVSPEAAAVGRFRVTTCEWRGATFTVAGTGYTGEDGVECSVPAEKAEEFWDAVLGAGIVPAGLGARDTLRLEAALPLHGNDLGPGITPLQAGLGWVVSWDKPTGFLGKDALAAEKQNGVRRKLVGIATQGRQPPRHGYPVLLDGKRVAELTSGNFSPVLGHGIALALMPTDPETGKPPPPGTKITLQVRNREVPGEIVTIPFVQKKKG